MVTDHSGYRSHCGAHTTGSSALRRLGHILFLAGAP